MPRGIPNKTTTKRAATARAPKSPALIKTRTALANARAKAKTNKKTARAAFVGQRAALKAIKVELRTLKRSSKAEARVSAKALKKAASIVKRCTKFAARSATILATPFAVKTAKAPKVKVAKAPKAPKAPKALKVAKVKVARRSPVGEPNPKAVALLRKQSVAVNVSSGVVPSTGGDAPVGAAEPAAAAAV